jgi:hypothetical protein
MSADAIIRGLAMVAAVVLIIAPALVGIAQKAQAWLQANPVAGNVPKDGALTDMRLVLDLAARLKAAGCTAGVALCQQLLDVMLGSDHPKANP